MGRRLLGSGSGFSLLFFFFFFFLLDGLTTGGDFLAESIYDYFLVHEISAMPYMRPYISNFLHDDFLSNEESLLPPVWRLV